MQTSEQARQNSTKGSGELSGENPVELSAQLLGLEVPAYCRVKIADIKVQIGERRAASGGRGRR